MKIDQYFISEDFFAAPVPEHLYRLDIDSRTIYDYCLDIQNWGESSDMHVSPDEKFVAITLYEDTKSYPGKKDTLLLNLATGDRAFLPHYQTFGWVRVDR